MAASAMQIRTFFMSFTVGFFTVFGVRWAKSFEVCTDMPRVFFKFLPVINVIRLTVAPSMQQRPGNVLF